MLRPKIAVVHPPFGWGGSDAVALWTVEALKDDYDVSLITSGEVNLSRLNLFHGTSLMGGELSILPVPIPLGLNRTKKFAALRGRFIQRYCQRVATNFDLMISAYNPCDFGIPGIQLVADLEDLPQILPLKNWKRMWYGDTPLRRAYLTLCDWISSGKPEGWMKNLTLANSKWTAGLIQDKYGVEVGVIYPPVSSQYSLTRYENKSNGFVCIGRIIPEKRIEDIVEILARVRTIGHEVHLHVVGGPDGKGRYSAELQEKLHKLYPDWVFFEGRIDEESKNSVISNHRYGISGRIGEPFGIAVAEMVKAGSIVLVPDNGGQVEIVDHPNLVYLDVPDAVYKIDYLLNNVETHTALREHLLTESQKFSVETFQTQIKGLVSDRVTRR